MSAGAVLALSLLSDAALAWWLLFRRRDRPLALRRVLTAGGAALAFALLKASVLIQGFWRPFLALHVLYLFLFLAAPAFAALVALGRPRAATRPARTVAGLLALALAAVGIDSHFIEPWALRTETAAVGIDPARAGRAELVIGVLADIQCTEVTAHERDAVARVMAAQPDLILIPGDLGQLFTVEAWRELQPAMQALLAPLSAPLGVYAVGGNCDPPEIARALLAGTQVRYLHDEIVQRTWRDRTVTIAGVQLDVREPGAKAVLRELSAPGGDDLRILCAHLPDAALALPPGGRVDLVVAGHTHGGQVRLPWIGPLITLSRVPREVAGGGLHTLNGTQLYVSRGIGHEQGDAPRVRFNCPPEVTLLTLSTAEAAAPARSPAGSGN